MTLDEVPIPEPGPNEVRIRNHAAALNFFDTLLIAGKYQHKPPFPFSPGAEFAGVVESVGSGAADIAPGDRVIGYSGWGAARELVAASVQRLVKIPDRLDFERALAEAKVKGHRLVLLVGDEPYYSRVGFKRIEKSRVTMPGPVDHNRLLIAELADGAFEGVSGAISPDWDFAK